MKMPARHLMHGLVWAALAIALSGCPFSGDLLVQPGSVSLSVEQTQSQMSITNVGRGDLSWTARTEEPWLFMRLGEEGMADREISGKTARTDIVTLFLEEDYLPVRNERLRGTIIITSSGGNAEIPVTFEPDRQPRLLVNPAELSFATSESRKTLDVLNEGAATLLWQATPSQSTPWLTVNPASGELTAGSSHGLNVTVNRTLLAPSPEPHRGEIIFESNGGSQIVVVMAEAGAFSAAPAALDFGLIAVPKTLMVALRTQSPETVLLSTAISYEKGGGWLSVPAERVEITRTQPRDFAVTANPAGLEPGSYTAVLSLAHGATAQTESITVKMEVGKATDFSLSVDEIDFGTTNEIQEQSVTLTNLGDEALNFIVKKQSPAPWLTVSPESGSLTGTTAIRLAADPSRLPVGVSKVTLEIQGGSVTRLLRVLIDRAPDIKTDQLQVEPRDLNFGSLESRKDINLWNEGPNAIDWFIDESTLPQWLSLSASSGTLSGSFTDSVVVTIDRNLTPSDGDNFSHVIKVESNTAGIAPVELIVRGQPRRFPVIHLEGEGADANNVPFIMIDIGEDSASFTVENKGTAALTWNVDQAKQPGWIASIAPLQGELAPGKKQKVTVTTNRKELTQTGGNYRLPIRSNDIDAPLSYVEVQVRVPIRIVIGTRPQGLNFGLTESTLSFEVANQGDAGWPLEYKVTSSQPEWLFAEPARGRSMGTPTNVKDWQFVSVAIDRGSITNSGASATLTITAENVPPNAHPVEPVEVTVQLDLAEMTIEAAAPRVRPPSLIRAAVLLRDIRQRTFPIFEDNYLDSKILYNLTTPAVSILENSLPIDLDETNVFVKKDEELRFSVLILMDFSGSMAQAAQKLVDDGQLEVGPGDDPLTVLYRETVGAMIDEMPDHYEVALAVFNERNAAWNSATRMLRGAPAGYDSDMAQAPFTKNKAIQQYRLNSVSVADNGATPLFPALAEAALELYQLGGNMPDFDNLGQSILIPITDGRQTTPPGDITAITEILRATRTRTFTIGWGNQVFANSLIQIADESGGHYYATVNKRVPGEVDTTGEPLTVPVKEELLKWCRKNPEDANARSIVSDLKSHIVLSYATLNEEPSMEIQAHFEVDTQVPSLKKSIYFSSIPAIDFANDVRLGQIGMNTDGIRPDKSASVRFYTDYIPRNITRLSFNIKAAAGEAWTAELVPAEQGGLLAGWTMIRSGNVLTLTSKASHRPLDYADYGKLFDIHLSNVNAPTELQVQVLEPQIQSNPDIKYFTIPKSIGIDYQPARAVSFPNAEFDFEPAPASTSLRVIDLGNLRDLPEDERYATAFIRNIGGEHMLTNVGLFWTVREGTEWLPGTWSGRFSFKYNTEQAPSYGTMYSVYEADAVTVAPTGHYDTDGELISDAGSYSRSFYIDVTYGSLYYLFSYGPYYVKYDVD